MPRRFDKHPKRKRPSVESNESEEGNTNPSASGSTLAAGIAQHNNPFAYENGSSDDDITQSPSAGRGDVFMAAPNTPSPVYKGKGKGRAEVAPGTAPRSPTKASTAGSAFKPGRVVTPSKTKIGQNTPSLHRRAGSGTLGGAYTNRPHPTLSSIPSMLSTRSPFMEPPPTPTVAKFSHKRGQSLDSPSKATPRSTSGRLFAHKPVKSLDTTMRRPSMAAPPTPAKAFKPENHDFIMSLGKPVFPTEQTARTTLPTRYQSPRAPPGYKGNDQKNPPSAALRTLIESLDLEKSNDSDQAPGPSEGPTKRPRTPSRKN